MNKKFDYDDGKFIIKYDFTEEHLITLFVVKSNDGYVAFKNRDITCEEDLDGNEISWKVCDDLVEMGLLWEDEEAFDVAYELSNDGESAMKIISSKF
jgi:hypothetical protein